MAPLNHFKFSSSQERESDFSLVWVMEVSIIYSCLCKAKVFPVNLTKQSQSTFNVCMETVDELYVFLTEFILCLKAFFAVSHCFIKMLHSQQSQGILFSIWCNNFRRVQQELDEGNFYPFDRKTFSFLSSNCLLTKNIQPQENHAYLTDSQCITTDHRQPTTNHRRQTTDPPTGPPPTH